MTDPYRISLSGEIDLTRAPELHRMLDDVAFGDARDVVVDLTEVTFCDSTGLAFLAGLNEQCSRRGTLLTVSGPTRHVRRVLDLVTLEPALVVLPVGG